jgi:hypothetical protein
MGKKAHGQREHGEGWKKKIVEGMIPKGAGPSGSDK